jgi:hypothetical protein
LPVRMPSVAPWPRACTAGTRRRRPPRRGLTHGVPLASNARQLYGFSLDHRGSGGRGLGFVLSMPRTERAANWPEC